MSTVATARAQGQSDAKKQEIKQKALELKVVIFVIDKFVESLVDRLKNPNKAGILGFGSPAPVKQGDIQFDECLKVIKKHLGKGLANRSFFSNGSIPPQYTNLQRILDEAGNVKNIREDSFDDPRINFLDRFKMFFLSVKNGFFPECNSYQRVINLFLKKTTEEKDKFDYDALYNTLDTFVKPTKTQAEKQELDEAVQMAIELSVLEAKQKMATPPTGIASTSMSKPMIAQAQIEEPAPNITEAEIREAASSTSAAPAGQKPLSDADKDIVRSWANQIEQGPLAKQLYSNDPNKIYAAAEKAYRKRTGKGRRKTYRKKKASRKTRKVRRV